MICCPAGTSLELQSQDVPAPDNKSLGCCRHNSLPPVINPLNLTGMHVLSYALLLTNSIFLPCRHASPQVTTMNSSFTFGQSANGHHRPITPDDDGLSYSSTELDASVQEPSGMNSFLNGNHQSNLTFGSGKTSFVTSLWNGKTRKVLKDKICFELFTILRPGEKIIQTVTSVKFYVFWPWPSDLIIYVITFRCTCMFGVMK